MQRQNRTMEGMVRGSCKIRKRGCSSSSSTSSILRSYRFKRVILVGRPRGSRSITPTPTWKTSSSSGMMRVVVESPKYAPPLQSGGKSMPVSARTLAATLWEMNEVPSPSVRENSDENMLLRRERMLAARTVHSGSLPPHLSDPAHSPVSERMDQSGTGSRCRRTSSISHGTRLANHNVGVLDSLSSASLIEIEARSLDQTTRGSGVGVKTRLKDVNNALTTSKELLRIINRIWAHTDQPSSSMSLMSALHSEIERARLQVHQLIQKEWTDQNEINYLMKCFGGELEVERKLRRRFETLNKKLGKELAETKESLVKAVKEVEREKRARERMEKVCDELARDIGEDKAEVEELKRESAKIHEEVEKEREMLQLADMWREERVQMKLSEAKHHFEEKNAVVDKLRNQLEAFLRTKRDKQMVRGSLSRNCFGSDLSEEEVDGGEVDDREEDSGGSDLHSVELNMDNNNKSYNWVYSSVGARDSRRIPTDVNIKGRNTTSGIAPRRSSSLQRSMSGEWGVQGEESIRNSGVGPDRERLIEALEKQSQRQDHVADMYRSMSGKGLRDHVVSRSRMESVGDFASPTRQSGQPWPSRDMLQRSGLKPKLVEARREAKNARRPKRFRPQTTC